MLWQQVCFAKYFLLEDVLGRGSLRPFLEYRNSLWYWMVMLALTAFFAAKLLAKDITQLFDYILYSERMRNIVN